MTTAKSRQKGLWTPAISDRFDDEAETVLLSGDSAKTLRTLPDASAKLIVTSPPYNLGKAYERATALAKYLDELTPILEQLIRVFSPQGSLCWQVGNYVEKGEIFPLDMHYYPVFKSLGLKLRNRIVWHFAHGHHCSKRFARQYETIDWCTKSDDFIFESVDT